MDSTIGTTGRRLSDEERREVLNRVAGGERYEEIAAKLRVSRKTIQRLVNREAPPIPRWLFESETRLTMVEREEIAHGLQAGESLRSIAARLGRAASTVSREVRRVRTSVRTKSRAHTSSAGGCALPPCCGRRSGTGCQRASCSPGGSRRLLVRRHGPRRAAASRVGRGTSRPSAWRRGPGQGAASARSFVRRPWLSVRRRGSGFGDRDDIEARALGEGRGGRSECVGAR
jgi:DNA-binding CsgD family transcriptional regulator